mmetsp:Transcript_24963/g.65049  ORF Transcript_24963/g.65049 Transcript_24963/m.65049 type:complete len:205 (-) Transcript_24963:38-652(-)
MVVLLFHRVIRIDGSLIILQCKCHVGESTHGCLDRHASQQWVVFVLGGVLLLRRTEAEPLPRRAERTFLGVRNVGAQFGSETFQVRDETVSPKSGDAPTHLLYVRHRQAFSKNSRLGSWYIHQGTWAKWVVSGARSTATALQRVRLLFGHILHSFVSAVDGRSGSTWCDGRRGCRCGSISGRWGCFLRIEMLRCGGDNCLGAAP